MSAWYAYALGLATLLVPQLLWYEWRQNEGKGRTLPWQLTERQRRIREEQR